MKLTVTTLSDQIFNLDVSEELELGDFKAFCEVESGIPASEMLVMHNGLPLVDNRSSLKDSGLHEGDVVTLQHIQASGTSLAGSITNMDFSGISVPSSSSNAAGPSTRPTPPHDVGVIREMILANPDQLALLKQNNPPLADALLSGDHARFERVLREQQEFRAERERQRIRMMNASPFDTETQRLIADEIRQKNIEANMEAAIEFHPESFGTVVMLYINCRVNGHPVKAFIDSGAQTTIMSLACAERCNLNRLIDARWAGIAKGVGTQKILGRIHMVQIQIEKDFLTTSFSILEEQPMDMLLGLDMLKRHQCCIDLKKNVLQIGTTGTETPFLSELDLPECARNVTTSEDDMLRQSAQEAEDRDLARALERSHKESREGGSRSGGGGDGSSTSSGARCQVPDPSTSILPTDKFTESDIKELLQMGFTREQVVIELRRFNGDKTQAMAALFAKSLKF